MNDGGPIFPTPIILSPQVGSIRIEEAKYLFQLADKLESKGGMSLRDYFAAAALTGMMASRNPSTPTFRPEDDADFVYQIADAMLKNR